MNNILTSLVSSSIARFGADREAFAYLESPDSELVRYTWGEISESVKSIAGALLRAGISEGDAVSVFAPNMGDTLLVELACYSLRAVPVSIYPTSSHSQVEYIVKDSKSTVICVGAQRQYDVFREVQSECGDVRLILAMSEKIEIEPTDNISVRLSAILSTEASDSEIEEMNRRTAVAAEDDVATLLYTSGTTGEPKGTILPHSCFNAQLEFHKSRLVSLSESDTSLCFLPLSHIFEKAWTYFCLWRGVHVTVNSDTKAISAALLRVWPTCMCAVPRFWEKAYMAVQEKFASMPAMRRRIFKAALQVGFRRNLEYVRLNRKVPFYLALKYKLYDKLVYSKIRRAIGFDNPNILPTAGAPLGDSIVEFFRALGIPIVIGYGLSETTATVTCYPYEDYKIGTVGTVIDGVSVKIGEGGEVLVKGPTVMRGYYNKEKQTEEAFTEDGWFKTGDAGCLQPDGSLVLTERIKDLFKTSNGKYIAPQAIESRLGGDPYIEQVAVIGDRRKYVTAIVIPAFEALKRYARKHRIKYRNLDDLICNSDIRDMMERRIERLQSGLAAFEKIKKFTLLPKEFTIESGEITNTLKLCRPVIANHYSKEIEAMYR